MTLEPCRDCLLEKTCLHLFFLLNNIVLLLERVLILEAEPKEDTVLLGSPSSLSL